MPSRPDRSALVSVDVGEAVLGNGLLDVDLTRHVPESVVQTIKIKRSGAK